MFPQHKQTNEKSIT